LGHVAFLEQLLAEAEICEFYHSIFEQDVGGLEIPVQNPGLVKCEVGLPDLLEQLECVGLGDLAPLLDELGEGAAIAVFVDEIDVGSVLEHLLELDDVGVVDLGQHRHLDVSEL